MPKPKIFNITQDNRAPSITGVCVDENENVVPLTAAISVTFVMKDQDEAVKVNAAAVIVGDPLDGRVKYNWQAADTDAPGDYDAEFVVLWSDGTTTTFPNHSYIQVRVKRRLE